VIDRLPLLAGIIVIQLLFVVASQFIGRDSDQTAPFLTFDITDITNVSVADGDGMRVELIKEEAGWQLAESSGIPADDEKVAQVLEKLSSLGSPWPVATSTSSQTRFEVTQENHQRNVQLMAGDELIADLYLGTSPGYRRVHARNAGDDKVYSIDFANFEVPATRDDWLDKSLLQATDITAVKMSDGWSLTRVGETWLVDGQPADEDKAQKLVDRISQIRVLGFHEAAPDAADSSRTLQITGASGDYQLTIAHDTAEDEYVVTSDRRNGSYSLASYVAEEILVDAGQLTVTIEDATAEAPAEAPDEAPAEAPDEAPAEAPDEAPEESSSEPLSERDGVEDAAAQEG
jgi:hypothetical protein